MCSRCSTPPTYAERKVCVIGRSMVRNLNISRNLGYAHVEDDLLIRPRDLDATLPRDVVILCTGSQGEPRSALTRMALGEHQSVHIHPTDTVIMSSRAVPGNEVNVHQTVNRLSRIGATVLTEQNAYVHVSGHGSADELRELLEAVRPATFVPVHGEYRMLRAHGEIAQRAGVARDAVRIADNGTVLELDGDGLLAAGQIEAGITLVDGFSVGELRDEVLRDRRRLATDGVLIVVATIAADTAEVVVDPEVIVRGFEAPDGDEEQLLDTIRDAVDDALDDCQAKGIKEVQLVQERLHDALAAQDIAADRQAPDGAAGRRRGLTQPARALGNGYSGARRSVVRGHEYHRQWPGRPRDGPIALLVQSRLGARVRPPSALRPPSGSVRRAAHPLSAGTTSSAEH